MTGDPRAFRPEELLDPAAGPPEAEVAEILPAVRDLEAVARSAASTPSAGFAERVMAAVAAEPAPRMAGLFAGLRAHPGPTAFLVSAREAWAMATRPGRAMGTRAAALAYVLAIAVAGASIGGAATIGVAGVIDRLNPDVSPVPSLPVDASPGPSLGPSIPPASGEPGESHEPFESEEPGESHEPDESAEPTGSPEPSETPDRSATPRPSDSPEPSDSETPEPSGSPDESDEPSGSPDASDTPDPSGTPKPSETPH